MALGYCEAIVRHLQNIDPTNYAGRKVTPQGFTNMLMAQKPTYELINEPYMNGHRREQRLKYKVRSTEAQVQTSASCGVDIVPAYKETTVALNDVVSLGIHMTDDTIRQYCVDASNMVTLGTPPTRLMEEHLDSILSSLNGMYAKMERVLTTKMALNFGKNARTGSTASTNVNFNLNGATQNFQEGLTRILADAQINEICETPIIVGGGNIHGFAVNKRANAIGMSQYGIDANALADAMGFEFYLSNITQNTWGSNQFGVFAPGAVQLVENMQYVNSFAQDLGTVKMFTFVDPRVQCYTPNGLQNVAWDVKMIYNACSESKAGGYLGTATYGQGWEFIISKNYGLFIEPNDMYDGADVINGQNGTLRYTAQNA
jgi:hypothetical protein